MRVEFLFFFFFDGFETEEGKRGMCAVYVVLEGNPGEFLGGRTT